jgi:hypothetical protein
VKLCASGARGPNSDTVTDSIVEMAMIVMERASMDGHPRESSFPRRHVPRSFLPRVGSRQQSARSSAMGRAGVGQRASFYSISCLVELWKRGALIARQLAGLAGSTRSARWLPRHHLEAGDCCLAALDAYWNFHATWFMATTALKYEALSLGVRLNVA